MIRKTSSALVGLVASLSAVAVYAQAPKSVAVVMDYEECDKFRDRLQKTPAAHEDFQKAVCANLHKLFPAWRFQPSSSQPPNEFPQLKLKFRGDGQTVGKLSVDVRVEVRRDDDDSPETVLKWVTLFPSGAVATAYHDLGTATAERLEEKLSDEKDEARAAVQKIPVSDGFLECHTRLRALLPLTWEEFKKWSFSHFRAEFASPETVTLISEAVGKPHKSHIPIQHTKVKKVGQPERDVDEDADDFRSFQIGSIYVERLRRNDHPDSGEPIANRDN